MERSEIFKCLNDPDYMVSKYFLSDKLCMAYNKKSCEGEIINAHTISRKYIKNISENNLIYYPAPSNNNSNGLYDFKPMNLKSATCFTGFCRFHDVNLFKSFENSDFNYSYRQIYDVSLRALCREYYLKKCLWKFYHKISKGELRILDINGYSKSPDFNSKRQHLLREVKDHKYLYEEFRKFINSGLNYIVIKTNKLPIMTTGILFPLNIPYGEIFQELKKKQHGFVYNVLSLANETYIVISTVKSSKKQAHREYLSSLLKLGAKELVNYILTNAFFNNDNIVINPNWFQQVGSEFQTKLTRLMNLQSSHYAERVFSEIIDFSEAIDFSPVTIISQNILK